MKPAINIDPTHYDSYPRSDDDADALRVLYHKLKNRMEELYIEKMIIRDEQNNKRIDLDNPTQKA